MTFLNLNRLLAIATVAVTGLTTVPSLAANVNPDLATWTCAGACGSLGANGDITLSPLNSTQYGYLTTAGSSAHNVSPLSIAESGGQGSTFFQTNGSSYTSAAFNVAAGESVEAYFNYVSTDGKGFDDYAWARLVDAGNGSTVAWLFNARSTNGNKQSVVPGNALGKASNNTVDFDPDTTIVNYDDFDFNTRNTDIGNPVDWSPLGDSNGACWRGNAEGCGFTGWLLSRVTPGAGTYRLEIGVVNFGDELYDSGLAFDLQGLVAAPVPVPAAIWLLGSALIFMGVGRRNALR